MDDSPFFGRLAGVKTAGSMRYVSVQIPGGEAMLSPADFPAEEWIERNVGRWVAIFKDAGGVRVRLFDMDSIVRVRIDSSSGMQLYECAVCGFEAGRMSLEVASSPAGHGSAKKAKNVADAFSRHMHEEHPDADPFRL